MNRYIVFMKQVPLSTKIDMDPETKTLKRSSALAQVNPDDLHALQCALDLKKLTGAEVVAVTMGPPSAEEVLREALQRGADRGILLTSRAFAGSDTYCKPGCLLLWLNVSAITAFFSLDVWPLMVTLLRWGRRLPACLAFRSVLIWFRLIRLEMNLLSCLNSTEMSLDRWKCSCRVQ